MALTPIYRADVVVLEVERDQRRERAREREALAAMIVRQQSKLDALLQRVEEAPHHAQPPRDLLDPGRPPARDR